MLGWLGGEQAGTLEHSEPEGVLQADARELFRQLDQDHLTYAPNGSLDRGCRRRGGSRWQRRAWRHAWAATVFGAVEVTRIAYRAAGRRTCTGPTGR